MLNGIQNFLQFINDNWTAIIIIISLIIAIVQKARSYFNKSNAEKIEVAKKQISQVVLKLITDAEIDYNDLVSAGSIKRSQVIQKIFNDYPILTKASDPKAIIEWIDDMINNSLKELRKIVEINKSKEVDLPNDKSE